MVIILVILLIFAIIVLITYSKNNSNANLPDLQKDFSKTYYFENEKKISKVKVGDFANVWTKEDSNQIYAYREDTFGGEGLIGICYNKKLHTLLNLNPKAKLDCRIVSVSGKTASINISVKPNITSNAKA